MCSKCVTLSVVINQLRQENRQLKQKYEDLEKQFEKLFESESAVVVAKKRKRIVKVRNTTVPTDFPCTECIPTIFLKTAGALRLHILNHHGTKFPCKERGCNKVFGRAAPLRDHRNKDHGMLNPYVCEDCGAQFPTYKTWHTHKTKEHSGKFVCGVCHTKFYSQLRLDTHWKMGTCNLTQQEKNAKIAVLSAAGAALGTAHETKILDLFEQKNNVKLERVGGISKSKKHPVSGKEVVGSCDGIEPGGRFCVEVKVVTSENRWRRQVKADNSGLNSSDSLRELLRAMFVNNMELGYMAYLYVIEGKEEYYQFDVKWQEHQQYFDSLYVDTTY